MDKSMQLNVLHMMLTTAVYQAIDIRAFAHLVLDADDYSKEMSEVVVSLMKVRDDLNSIAEKVNLMAIKAMES